MHADDVANLKDSGMVLQLFTEDIAADLLVGLISDLQAGAEVCAEKTSCDQISGEEPSIAVKRSKLILKLKTL